MNDNNLSIFKRIIRILAITALVLLAPLIAMQFTEEVDWDWFDFTVIGVLLIGTGLIYELAASKVSSKKHKVIIGTVLLALLLLTWAELAVGLFGTPFAGS